MRVTDPSKNGGVLKNMMAQKLKGKGYDFIK